VYEAVSAVAIILRHDPNSASLVLPSPLSSCIVCGSNARSGINWLVIKGAHLPNGEVRINYLEAYCRPGSTDADWVKHTVIHHTNELV
jgi:hypothetical protein